MSRFVLAFPILIVCMNSVLADDGLDFLSPLNRYEIDYTEGGDWSTSPPMQFDDPVIQ